MLSNATGVMMVESVMVALADPPPDTVTELICGEVAVEPTFTVAVIAG
jgi:hypothetical protein